VGRIHVRTDGGSEVSDDEIAFGLSERGAALTVALDDPFVVVGGGQVPFSPGAPVAAFEFANVAWAPDGRRQLELGRRLRPDLLMRDCFADGATARVRPTVRPLHRVDLDGADHYVRFPAGATVREARAVVAALAGVPARQIAIDGAPDDGAPLPGPGFAARRVLAESFRVADDRRAEGWTVALRAAPAYTVGAIAAALRAQLPDGAPFALTLDGVALQAQLEFRQPVAGLRVRWADAEFDLSPGGRTRLPLSAKFAALAPFVFHNGRLCDPEATLATVPRGAALTLVRDAAPFSFCGVDGVRPEETLASFLARQPPAPHAIYTHQPDAGGPARAILRRMHLLPLRGTGRRAFDIEPEDPTVKVRVALRGEEEALEFDPEQAVADVRRWIEDRWQLMGDCTLSAGATVLDDDDRLCDLAMNADGEVRIDAALPPKIEFVVGAESVAVVSEEEALHCPAGELAQRYAPVERPTSGGAGSQSGRPSIRLAALGRVLAPEDRLADIGVTAPARVFVHTSVRRRYTDMDRTALAANIPKRNIPVRHGEEQQSILLGVHPEMNLRTLGEFVLRKVKDCKSVSFVAASRRLCMSDENAESVISEGVVGILHTEAQRSAHDHELLAWMSGGQLGDPSALPDEWPTRGLIRAKPA
jgi:hypothetical protein